MREELAAVIRTLQVSPDHFINGRRVPSTERFEVRSPVDWSQVLALVARGGREEVFAAVDAAEKAFPGWSGLRISERAAYLRRLADVIETQKERLAKVECLDSAMLERSLRERVIQRAAWNYRFYADFAEAHEDRVWRSNGTENRVERMPAGPAAIITPWNAPFMLSTWKTAPALMAGCTVVLKPPEWAPLSGSLLAELVERAGFPPGVFNVVQGMGEEAGAALVSHPGIRRIGFTGSPETGKTIMGAAASHLVPVTFELGGKSPFVVFADANLEIAAQKAAGQYDDAGQVCLAGTRLLVERSVADEFLERFHRHVDRHVLGDPRDERTTLSPLIHPKHLERVEGFVERARENGDRILRGGQRSEIGGLWYEPTLIEPKSNQSEIVQREVFGPVLTFQTFEEEEEAIALANSTPYGLAAVVFTSSKKRMDRVTRTVRAGTVWGNCFLVRDLSAPFGGAGISGIGREGGDYALDFYSDLKTVQVREGTIE